MDFLIEEQVGVAQMSFQEWSLEHREFYQHGESTTKNDLSKS